MNVRTKEVTVMSKDGSEVGLIAIASDNGELAVDKLIRLLENPDIVLKIPEGLLLDILADNKKKTEKLMNLAIDNPELMKELSAEFASKQHSCFPGDQWSDYPQ